MKFLFVGEEPSQRAIDLDKGWYDGALAGKQLFDALIANNIDPLEQRFCNLFSDGLDVVMTLKGRRPIVAMGKKVQAEFDRLEIPHIKLTHPAARGKIRKKERYIEHVKEQLCT